LNKLGEQQVSAKPLWEPSQRAIENFEITKFSKAAGQLAGQDLSEYRELHRWSVEHREAFWNLVWDYCAVRGMKGKTIISNADKLPGAHFFPEARLNFAENLLWKTGSGDALVFRSEDQPARRMNWDELRDLVSRLQQAFRKAGVGMGDRVAAMMPNMPETIACMLATASLGATWCSCSPDFGVGGVLDRFGQIEPKIFIGCDGYRYNGKIIDTGDKLQQVSAELDPLATIVVNNIGNGEAIASAGETVFELEAFIAPFESGELHFEQLPFSHPLYILFSSGTTGKPKCIVHSAGGTLLQHLKEHRLHADLHENDRLFYFTTCGWMMWNWLVSGLASGVTLLLYDGSPFFPDGNVLFDLADSEAMTYFGTSAKFIDAVRKSGLRPIDTHDLSNVRVISSTGSPLSPEGFEFVYDGIKNDVHLASISGGTDIVSCFVLGVPGLPVWSGELQGPALGMAVDVWDDDGKPMKSGKGELVCTRAFPSMPIGFWNDDGTRYHAAYFERFDNVWCHGDFAEWTEHGGMIIHGRSDATLNPGGVRIGTAEIYNQVELMDEILEAICIGQDYDGDTRVVLFVRLADGVDLDEALIRKIKDKIRKGATPRHVPAVVVAVADIPRTKSGKITELAVRDVVHGRDVKNKEALANPEALELYRGLPELE
jgi:acetoacetyl-CoA synthetase